METDGPFGVQPSELMKDYKKKTRHRRGATGYAGLLGMHPVEAYPHVKQGIYAKHTLLSDRFINFPCHITLF